MGKVKSAICFTLITLIIAVLIGVCFVSFPCGEMEYYNSLLSLTGKDSQLGGHLIGDLGYSGGGYSVVYYPEGVITSGEYKETLAGKSGEDAKTYADKYSASESGALYFEKEIVLEEGTKNVSADFKAGFEKSVSLLKTRFEALHTEGTSVEVIDDYTVRVTLPATQTASDVAFDYLSRMGEFKIKYGSSETDAETIIPSQKGVKHSADYYVKGSSSSYAMSGKTYMVRIAFTDEGREIIKNATATSNTMYFFVGDKKILSLKVDSVIDQKEMGISGQYTAVTSALVASLIDTSVKSGSETDIALNMSQVSRLHASFGDLALILVYAALGALMLAMAVLFLVRYRRLGIVHIYSFLIFAIAMTVCVWAIGLSISAGTVAAFALTAALLCASNVVTFRSAKKEYATGKTLNFSIKTGYKKCTWSLFDLHIVLFAIAMIVYLIALTELKAFALVFALGALFSGVISLIINRFLWHITMNLSKNPGKFCHFKRDEGVEEDD